MIPGRSGPEFAEALLQLERFADLHGVLGQSYSRQKPQYFEPEADVVCEAPGTHALQEPVC